MPPWPEAGLAALGSPADPQPGLRIPTVPSWRWTANEWRSSTSSTGSWRRTRYRSGIRRDRVYRARSLECWWISTSREEVAWPTPRCTAAKLVDIVQEMTVLEMMMGLAKMRARRTPATRRVTNRKEHPALLAARAARPPSVAARSKRRWGSSRYAPLNALAILVRLTGWQWRCPDSVLC